MTDEKNKKPDDAVAEDTKDKEITDADASSEEVRAPETVPSVKAEKGEADDPVAEPDEAAQPDEPAEAAPVTPVAPAAQPVPARADWLARIVALAALAIAGAGGYAMYGQGAFDPLIRGEGGPAARLAALETTVAAVSGGSDSAELQAALGKAEAERQAMAKTIAELQARLAAAGEASSSGSAPADTDSDVEEALNELQNEVDYLQAVAEDMAAMKKTLAQLTGAHVAASAASADADTGADTDGEPANQTVEDPAEDTAEPAPEKPGLAQVAPEVLAQLATLQGGHLALQKDVAEKLDVMSQGIERRVTDLRLAYEQRLAALEQRTAEIAATPRGADPATIDRAAMVLALGRMQQAAESGRPFDASWQAANALDKDGIVAPLKAFAATGVPSVQQLAEQFPAAADQAVTAERLDQASGWLEKTTQRAAAAITVRRTGELVGSDAEALVARAELRLAEGDLNAALAELDRLGEEPARAMKDWRGAAERRQALDDAVRNARRNLFDNLAKGD